MPDPFFASTKSRKRKRSALDTAPSKKFARQANSKPHTSTAKEGAKSSASKTKRRDEELSDETNDEGGGSGVDDMDLRAPDVVPDAYESADEDEDETPAEKRLRLAKMYLENVKQGLSLGALICIAFPSCAQKFYCIALADGEYDAAEIDRELISSRLKQDVMEHSGKVHLFVAESVSAILRSMLLHNSNNRKV